MAVFTKSIALLIICQYFCAQIVAFTVFFEPGYDYKFRYTGTSNLGEVGTFYVDSQVRVRQLGLLGNDAQHCLLSVDSFSIKVLYDDEENYAHLGKLDFKDWLSFSMDKHGHIERVFYDAGTTNYDALELKKRILTVLSNKLIISDIAEEENHRWGYKAEEIDSKGKHSTTYQATPAKDKNNVLFHKKPINSGVETSDHTYQKEILLDRELRVPMKSEVTDVLQIDPRSRKKRAADGYEENDVDPNYVFPVIKGNGKATLTFVRKIIYIGLTDKVPTNLTADSLEHRVIPLPNFNQTDAFRYFNGNLTCLLETETEEDNDSKMHCFNQFKLTISRTSPADLLWLVLKTNSSSDQEAWKMVVSGLGAASTNESFSLLAELVIESHNQTFNVTMIALAQLIGIRKCPPKVLTRSILNRVMNDPWLYKDENETEEVNDRAVLVLGSLTNIMQQCNASWATFVTKYLHDTVGLHDPYHHKHRRELMSQRDFKHHISKKAVHIMALSNGRHPSSYEYLLSYINDTKSHIQLRGCALRGLSRYEDIETAQILLNSALTDPDETVRIKATDAYTLHPHGGDLRYMISTGQYKYSNITDPEHVRVRRSILDVTSRIWQGFHFHLSTPSFDWQKMTGGPQLGGSIGVQISNFFNIDIAPLSGSAIVNIYDKAWATLHLGIVRLNLHIFLADICFRGHVEYDLNVFAEYSRESVDRISSLMDRVVSGAVRKIRRSIENFRTMVDSIQNIPIEGIIQNFVSAVREMPRNVLNLNKIARRLENVLEEYDALPPVFELIKNFVQKIKRIYSDIKSDVMDLHNAIIDTVETTLAWAWDEIRESFNLMVQSLRNIVINPMSVIQNMGKGVARISMAIGVILDTKDKITEANIFATDNRPYWFDFSAVIDDISNDIAIIRANLSDTLQWLENGEGTETEEAMAYVGIDLTEIKAQILSEVWAYVLEETIAPFDALQTLLVPFILEYGRITEAIENIKEAWVLLVDGYNEGRTLFETIFGPKFHDEFPRKFLHGGTCPDGFWPSTGHGHYDNPGIDLEITVGSQISAPVVGVLRASGSHQVTITADSLKNLEIIIDNVEMAQFPNNIIGAGDVIGLVSRTWCNQGHVHISIRNTITNEFIDPSPFKRNRIMTTPRWVEDCDHYELVWKFETLQIGSITPGPATEDQTQSLSNAPNPADLELESYTRSTSTRRKKSVSEWIDRFQDFTQSLGLGDISSITQIFELRLADMNINTLINVLQNNGEVELVRRLNMTLQQLQELSNQPSCRRPQVMDDLELRATLLSRGQSISGSRGQLEFRIRYPDTACTGFLNHIPENSICTFDDNCHGFSCCVEFSVFSVLRISALSYIMFDPCEQRISIGVNEWITEIEIPSLLDFENIVGSSVINVNVGNIDVIQLVARYDITLENRHFKINLIVAMCSSLREQCRDIQQLAEGVQIQITACQDITSTRQATDASLNISRNLALPDIMIVAELADLLDLAGLDEEEIHETVQDIREACVSWVLHQVNEELVRVYENALSASDVCLLGYEHNYGPYHVTIYEQQPPIIFPLGWFNLVFRFGLGGYYGSNFQCQLCLLSMKAKATAKPMIGAIAWGSVGLEAGPFRVQLRLVGYLLTTEFPTKAEVEFTKFPLDVKARMDLKLTPLRMTLYGEIIYEISFSIWDTDITIRKVFFSKELWQYTSSTVNKNIFNKGDLEPDRSPPEFISFGNSNERRGNSEGAQIDKRDISSSVDCTVVQIVGKDYTEPAFNIEYDAADDRSNLDVTLCVGTYIGGCDVLQNEPLTGISSLQSRELYNGVELHFTVTAKNSQGDGASVSCSLSTYDTTLPTGRITPEFRSSSNPNILRCSVFVTDDSEIVLQQVSAGYGVEQYSSQIIPWQQFETDEHRNSMNSNTAGDRSMRYFSVPKKGRLVYPAFETHTFTYAERCARECLTHPLSKCLGFNYDYGSSGICQLVNSVEGHSKVQMSGSFHFFERLGVGRTFHLDRNDMQFTHDSMAFCNAYVQNILLYENYMVSEGIHYDHTPPDPGRYIVTDMDELMIEDCLEFTPDYLQQRCAEQTPLLNYRYITDVPFAECTICNGHTSGEELYWSRANRMISCNWDHIHDNETGILVYTWAVGTEPCDDNVHPHRDPHAHIHKESEWTHQGVAFPLNLPDGIYHITLTALNEVDFGGPMALRICHQTPYIIDTTPPIIIYIEQAEYDRSTHMITMNTTAEDDLSGIRKRELGLGRTRRDTYLLPFVEVEETNPLYLVHQLPNGIPTWVKVRYTNNVDLRESGHSPTAIFIDDSAPVAGTIFMGTIIGLHTEYQHNDNILCANWEDFFDPESGLAFYKIAFGSQPWAYDIVDWTMVDHTEYIFCQDGLSLIPNHRYYATLIAFNSATIQRNVSATSLPILVDITAPVIDNVKDGSPHQDDISYSSSASSIAVTWSMVYDPESGIENIDVIFVKQGPIRDLVIHEETGVPVTINTLHLHHFRLQHNDYIYTTVNITNGAVISTELSSDGFLVDLTEPVMNFIGDGLESHTDLQYWASANDLAANWDFSDVESGISTIRISSYSTIEGINQQIFPISDESWTAVDPTSSFWSSGPILELDPGHIYFTRIMVINGAGLTAVFDTDGLLVDTTPPEIIYVHAGVLSGDSEENIDGYVYSNDLHGLRGSWKGRDLQSGISCYRVGVGISPGNDDTLSFFDAHDEDGYLVGLSLQVTDITLNHPSPAYYISVIAINGAGQESEIRVSSPIIVVDEDQNGVVWDGHGASISDDIDFQIDESTLSISFSGFESALNGIQFYDWAIGTHPRFDDIMEFTDYGIIVTNNAPRGLGSTGIAMIERHLQHGQTYYATIRAITGAGNVMDVCTDGITIDQTPPTVNFVTLQNSQDIGSLARIYHSDMSLEASWSSSDQEGYITDTVLVVGTVPGGDDVYQYENVSIDELTAGTIYPVESGRPNFITLYVENEVGLVQSLSSVPITIDSTVATEGHMDCPIFISGSTIKCSLWGFQDLESGISHFESAVGLSEGDSSIAPFQHIDVGSNDFVLPVDLSNNVGNQEYYVTLKVINNAILQRTIYSGTIFVDNTPPTAGTVIELLDHETYDISIGELWTPNLENHTKSDALCQRDVRRLHLCWTEFTDEDTGIEHYEIALGSTPGSTEVHAFIHISPSEDSYVFTNINLAFTPVVYATVRGFNNAGLHSTSYSNGIYISKISAGSLPMEPLLVYDGQLNHDLDFQTHVDSLSSYWNLVGDSCPITDIVWTVNRFDENVMGPPQTFTGDQTRGYLDEVSVHDRQSFYSVLKTTNYLNYSTVLHSNGITVKLEPVVPGIVRDGVIEGADLSFQSSNSTVGCNWDGFGAGRSDGTFDSLVEGENDIDEEVGEHQEIDHYEVAIGTDRTSHNTRTDIKPFTNVGRNTSWLFTDLNLESESQTSIYYCTVRAYSISTATTEVTSNGIRVGHGNEILSHGVIVMESFVPSTTSILASWSDFQFTKPILRFYWGIGLGDHSDTQIPCLDIVLDWGRHVLADVEPFHDIGLDSVVSPENLRLVHDQLFTIFVVALDETGTCDLAQHLFKVDVTPPTIGDIYTESGIATEVLYTGFDDAIQLQWQGFNDNESGIKSILVALYVSTNCNFNIEDTASSVPIADDLLPGNISSYAFTDIALRRDRSYFVRLELLNHANLKTIVLSKPIIVDTYEPTSGIVIDGMDINSDKTFVSSISEISGSVLYLPANIEACSRPQFRRFIRNSAFLSIIHKGLWNFNMGKQKNIHFLSSQINYSSNALTLSLQRKTTEPILKSGAITLLSSDLYDGMYEFEIQIANEPWAVTCVTFWNGPQGVFVAPTNYTEQENSVDGVNIIDAPLYSDTFPEGYRLREYEGNGFGFTLRVDDQGKTVLTLWGESNGNYRQTETILQFDASTAFHTYRFYINDERVVTDLRDWDIKLLVDEVIQGALGGITGVENAKLSIGLFNQDGYIPILYDELNPPVSRSVIRYISLPASQGAMCRPFKGGGTPIVAFKVGLGSDAGLDDVYGFEMVMRSPIPCGQNCDELFCDHSVNANVIQHISFTLQNLTLDQWSEDILDSDTFLHLQQAYFFTVQAITGSGKIALASSNGFYIDTSPPIISSIFHFDTDFNTREPVRFQGNNHTIRVVWNSEDPTSGIAENKWAIGSTPNGTDIQNFTSVGRDQFAFNSELSGRLLNNHTYFVTVMCINEAGLINYTSSEGVTILLDDPVVNNTPVDMPGTTTIGSEETNAVTSTSQSNFTVAFGTPPADQNIEEIRVSVGTGEGRDDILPAQQVGYNSSNRVSISDEGLQVGTGNLQPLNASNGQNTFDENNVARRRRSVESSQLLVDPGRAIRINIEACNAAHRCSSIPTKDIIVAREVDQIVPVNENGSIALELETILTAGTDTTVFSISTVRNQTNNAYLIVGALSRDDMTNEYKSDASSNFKPMVVDPVVTASQTSRSLYGRVRSVSETGFFITAIPSQPISGELMLSFNFDRTQHIRSSGATVPTLLAYCSEQEIWIDAAETCSVGNLTLISWAEERVELYVCDVKTFCERSVPVRRFRRQTENIPEDDTYTGSNSFVVAAVSAEYVNYPPVLTSESTYVIEEDAGILLLSLTAVDPEGDEYEFYVDATSSHTGTAELTISGELSYQPCEDCFGEDLVGIIIREVRYDDITAEESYFVINITITSVNDNPRLIVVRNGFSLLQESGEIIFVMEEFRRGKQSYEPIKALFSGYDVDHDGVNIYYWTVANGQILVQSQIETDRFESQNCSLNEETIVANWDNFETYIVEDSNNLQMIIPCQMEEDVTNKNVQWTLSYVEYTPREEYYGLDNLRVNARDRSEERLGSESLYVSVYVLANPCISGVCVGPQNDLDCESLERRFGFDGYSCDCDNGYTGEYCDINIDECKSNPCSLGFSCIDKVDGFECKCTSGGCLLQDWAKALIAITVMALIAIVVVVAVFCFLLRRKSNRNEMDRLIKKESQKKAKGVDNEGLLGSEEQSHSYGGVSRPPVDTTLNLKLNHDQHRPRSGKSNKIGVLPKQPMLTSEKNKESPGQDIDLMDLSRPKSNTNKATKLTVPLPLFNTKYGKPLTVTLKKHDGESGNYLSSGGLPKMNFPSNVPNQFEYDKDTINSTTANEQENIPDNLEALAKPKKRKTKKKRDNKIPLSRLRTEVMPEMAKKAKKKKKRHLNQTKTVFGIQDETKQGANAENTQAKSKSRNGRRRQSAIEENNYENAEPALEEVEASGQAVYQERREAASKLVWNEESDGTYDTEESNDEDTDNDMNMDTALTLDLGSDDSDSEDRPGSAMSSGRLDTKVLSDLFTEYI